MGFGFYTRKEIIDIVRDVIRKESCKVALISSLSEELIKDLDAKKHKMNHPVFLTSQT